MIFMNYHYLLDFFCITYLYENPIIFLSTFPLIQSYDGNRRLCASRQAKQEDR